MACAYTLKKQKPTLKIALLEKEPRLARHQTGNNSGVIHSGIYYKPGSLKAKNCIQGYQSLIDFCDTHEIPYDLCGKVIVATETAEIPALKTIFERGIANGLSKIRDIDQEELHAYEPHVRGIAGIHVPYTGIIDYTAVSEKYGNLFHQAGGDIFLNEKVEDIKRNGEGCEIITQTNAYRTKLVLNCAGLFSDKISALLQPKVNFRIIPFRGEYYELKKTKEHLVKTLIYPVPDPNFPFLGVHFTRMINGGVEAGPNAVFAFKKEGYKKTDFDFTDTMHSLSWPGFRKVMFKYWKTGLGEYYRSFSKAAFTKALQRLIPEITEDDLVPGGAGVRAQACDIHGGLIDDFLILEDADSIHVCNAPSPAATSSLSIAAYLADKTLKRF